ncbi:hypothetical protein U1739_14300 [Sphingomonas sp. PB4P5]
MKKLVVGGFTRIAVAYLLSLSNPAVAQSSVSNPNPPDSMVRSPGGVDMRSLRYIFNEKDLSIGNVQFGGLDFRRTAVNARPTRIGNDSFQLGTLGQFSDNWDIVLAQRSRGIGQGYDVSISSEGIGDSFYSTDLSFFSHVSSGYSELTRNPSAGGQSVYRLLSKGGGVITFEPGATGSLNLRAVELKASNGVVYAISYTEGGRRVVSNLGYALILENSQGRVTKACVLNIAVQTLPSDNVCPTNAVSTTYQYSGPFVSAVRAADGSIWPIESNFTTTYAPFYMRFYNPGVASPYMTLHYSSVEYHRVVLAQDFADGRHYDYGYDVIWYGETDTAPGRSVIIGYNYTLNGSDTTITSFDKFFDNPDRFAPVFSTGPAVVTDPIGRTTVFSYCIALCSSPTLASKQFPAGMREDYTYDGKDNLIKVVSVPKAGSGLNPFETIASYDCTTLLKCNKKQYSIDAKGNRTSFSYDPVHGQIVSETLPPVNGVSGVMRYSYSQRSAWYKNNDGSFVASTSPVWLINELRTCRSGATLGNLCATGAGDEIVTSYDYGPDAGPNNLLLRGKVVTADGVSLRTCYGYDAMGRKISETSPRAGLAVCP